jgi:hypothetical protein
MSIFRDLQTREPFWYEKNGSKYLIDPWQESAEIAGLQAMGAARREREAERELARKDGKRPKPPLTPNQLNIVRRRHEAAEYIVDWENVTWDDTGEEAECTWENRIACLAGNFGLTTEVWSLAFMKRQAWEDEKKRSEASRNGTGTETAPEARADANSATSAGAMNTNAPPSTSTSAST